MENLEPEIWKPIKGYDGLYEVSNFGRVKSLARKMIKGKNIFYSKERILKHQKMITGYYLIILSLDKITKGFLIHRLVGNAFIENPNNHLIINHIDGIKTNNYYKNLEWCSQKYNNHHAIR